MSKDNSYLCLFFVLLKLGPDLQTLRPLKNTKYISDNDYIRGKILELPFVNILFFFETNIFSGFVTYSILGSIKKSMESET